MAATYMGVKKEKDFAWGLVRTAWVSPCELAIAPMQDFLNLPSAARMNTPSTVGDNWVWRMEEQPGRALAKKIRELGRACRSTAGGCGRGTGIRSKEREYEEWKNRYSNI